MCFGVATGSTQTMPSCMSCLEFSLGRTLQALFTLIELCKADCYDLRESEVVACGKDV